MEEILNMEELKKHLSILKRTIGHATFSLSSTKFIKKQKFDDCYCCVVSLLPAVFRDEANKKAKEKIYKKKEKIVYKFPSVISFNKLRTLLITVFFLPNFYIINDEREAYKLIDTIIKNIEKDVELIKYQNRNF